MKRMLVVVLVLILVFSCISERFVSPQIIFAALNLDQNIRNYVIVPFFFFVCKRNPLSLLLDCKQLF